MGIKWNSDKANKAEAKVEEAVEAFNGVDFSDGAAVAKAAKDYRVASEGYYRALTEGDDGGRSQSG